MDNTFEYKGFRGRIFYEDGDLAFHGMVVGLRDVIHFQGCSIAELEQAFRESVDDYLQWLEAEGARPETP
jgi:predicted HicB family RNase H-like nuclease